MTEYTEEFFITGHENVLGLHKTTIEFTKEKELTKRGDCIIGVRSELGLVDFKEEFKALARSKDSKISCQILIDDLTEIIIGRGHPKLTYLNPKDIVIRKSSFICDRTVFISADKAALDIDRRIIEKLKGTRAQAKVIFTVKG